MVTLKDFAKTYETKRTQNIADLEKVDVNLQLNDGEGTDDEGKAYTYKFIEFNGERYRVPNSVIEEIKAIVKHKPELQFVKVEKSGTGLNTKYKVIQL